MEFTQEQIEKYKGLSAGELTDLNICPTCFDRATNRSVFGDDAKLKFFEDEDIECLFVSNPRAEGHAIITTKVHYHDLTDCEDKIVNKIFFYAKNLMKIIKQVYNCERVYLCTMCDGLNNHLHIQLIPRYSFEERGSKNFVKPRKDYVYDAEKFKKIKELTNKMIYN